MTIHLGRLLPAASSNLPERSNARGSASFPIWSCSKWGLPCHLCYQTRGALLPHRFILTSALACGWRFIFCCTFPRVTPGGRYPPPCLVEPGLSSKACALTVIRLSGARTYRVFGRKSLGGYLRLFVGRASYWPKKGKKKDPPTLSLRIVWGA